MYTWDKEKGKKRKGNQLATLTYKSQQMENSFILKELHYHHLNILQPFFLFFISCHFWVHVSRSLHESFWFLLHAICNLHFFLFLCVSRSTLHRVLVHGPERYSVRPPASIWILCNCNVGNWRWLLFLKGCFIVP